jgi:hypothetical protein
MASTVAKRVALQDEIPTMSPLARVSVRYAAAASVCVDDHRVKESVARFELFLQVGIDTVRQRDGGAHDAELGGLAKQA